MVNRVTAGVHVPRRRALPHISDIVRHLYCAPPAATEMNFGLRSAESERLVRRNSRERWSMYLSNAGNSGSAPRFPDGRARALSVNDATSLAIRPLINPGLPSRASRSRSHYPPLSLTVISLPGTTIRLSINTFPRVRS